MEESLADVRGLTSNRVERTVNGSSINLSLFFLPLFSLSPIYFSFPFFSHIYICVCVMCDPIHSIEINEEVSCSSKTS